MPTRRRSRELRWVMNFILGVRQIRGEMDIAPSRRLDVLLQNAGPTDLEYLVRNRHYLSRLAGIAEPRVLGPSEAAPIWPPPWWRTSRSWCRWRG